MRSWLRLAVVVAIGAALSAPAAGAEEPSTTTSSTTTSSTTSSSTTSPAPVPPQRLVFPVAGRVRYTDTFGAPRQGGKRRHEGQDLIGAKMAPLVSPVDGVVSKVTVPEPSTGYGLVITGTDGWIYKFVHVNNDRLGTDDGRAPLNLVYGPGITKGTKVVAGQLVGFLGDSGNAEGTVPHLHFEVRTPKNKAVNAYRGLVDAIYLDAPLGLPSGYELPPLGTTAATPKQKPKPCASPTATTSSTTSSTVAGDAPDPTTTSTTAAGSSTTSTSKPPPCTPAKKQPPKKKSTTTTTAKKKKQPTTTTTAKKNQTTTTTA